MGVFMMASVICPVHTSAQSPVRVIVSATAAPLFVKPDTARTPLRFAKEGSILNVIASEGEWYRVEFHDPQWGRRVGYIEKRHVNVDCCSRRASGRSQRCRIQASCIQTRSNRHSSKMTRWPPRQACPSFPPLRPRSVGASSRSAPSDFLGLFAFGDSGATSALGWMVSETGNVKHWPGASGRCERQLQQHGLRCRKQHAYLPGRCTLHGKAEWRTRECRSVNSWLESNTQRYTRLGISESLREFRDSTWGRR